MGYAEFVLFMFLVLILGLGWESHELGVYGVVYGCK